MQLRDGFYWFCDPSTPFYPGLHNLGSRDWTSDERDPVPTLGEWEGARRWHDGTPPKDIPRAVLVGTADCIENGYPANLPPGPVKDPFCEQVLPPACYEPAESMFAVTNIYDCLFAFNSAQLIGARYTSAPAAELLAQALCGPTATVLSAGSDAGIFPQITFAMRDNTAVAWIAGTTNFQQLALQAFYAGFGPVDLGLYSCNPLYNTAALNVLGFMSGAGAGGATRIVLCGHSYGGAVAVVAAAILRIANPNRKVEILTFGAPKAGDDRLNDYVDRLHQIHYANFGDPVPFLPPSGITYALLLPILGLLIPGIWAEFVRPRGVKEIAADGTITDYDPANQPEGAITTAATAIAAAVTAPAFRDHSVLWYAYYLCLGCGCVPKPCVPVPPAALNLFLGMRNYSYRFDAINVTNSIGIHAPTFNGVLATIIGHAPNGLPNLWRMDELPQGSLVVSATLDLSGNYASFRFQLEPNPTDPIFLVYWDFTAAAILGGGDFGNVAPTFFQPKVAGDHWNFQFEIFCRPLFA